MALEGFADFGLFYKRFGLVKTPHNLEVPKNYQRIACEANLAMRPPLPRSLESTFKNRLPQNGFLQKYIAANITTPSEIASANIIEE